MRMWMVPPEMMCKNHLLGEHLEIHMFVGAINKNKNIKGYLNGLLEFDSIESRHNELAIEMIKRGYNHNSPLPDILFKIENKKIDVLKNIAELLRRCEQCRKRYDEEFPF